MHKQNENKQNVKVKQNVSIKKNDEFWHRW